MSDYAGEGIHAEVWRAVAEIRGRKELRKTGALVLDPKATPKTHRDGHPDN